MMETPFELPDNVIIDNESGYAVNVPFIHQGCPGWWDDNPDVVKRITAARKKAGIKVEDFPDGKPNDDSFLKALKEAGLDGHAQSG